MYAVPIILNIYITTIVRWMLLFIIIVVMFVVCIMMSFITIIIVIIYLGNILTIWNMREIGSVRYVSRVDKDLVVLYLFFVLVLTLCRG